MSDANDSAVLTDGGITSELEVEQDYERHEHDKTGTQSMVLNMGPQHPSTHGVLRLLLELDGETILKAAPDIGRSADRMPSGLPDVRASPWASGWFRCHRQRKGRSYRRFRRE